MHAGPSAAERIDSGEAWESVVKQAAPFCIPLDGLGPLRVDDVLEPPCDTTFGPWPASVVATPGHTPDCITTLLPDERLLIVGRLPVTARDPVRLRLGIGLPVDAGDAGRADRRTPAAVGGDRPRRAAGRGRGAHHRRRGHRLPGRRARLRRKRRRPGAGRTRSPTHSAGAPRTRMRMATTCATRAGRRQRHDARRRAAAEPGRGRGRAHGAAGRRAADGGRPADRDVRLRAGSADERRLTPPPGIVRHRRGRRGGASLVPAARPRRVHMGGDHGVDARRSPRTAARARHAPGRRAAHARPGLHREAGQRHAGRER